ncbi:hypothetical protein AFM12_07990 [Jiulongibacter sediminis]|uniref:Uncharacterized protein n=1 Tax=Jiulongibacter sediminis TaxID=1605367 RepID=A0A0N8H9X0_9BACT|nr:hypothetical protein AFM12_07990 [Jiulongibacter sediminis]TBX25086.1 hypothetical protein TK44_07995 [Jiulongibacter sediminis]
MKLKKINELYFISNEVIIKLFPLAVVVFPYFFISKEYAGEISYTLALFIPASVYLIGNLKQEALMVASQKRNFNHFLSEKILLTIIIGSILTLILFVVTDIKIGVITWRITDILVELLLIPFFIAKDYKKLILFSLLRLSLYLILFFLTKFLLLENDIFSFLLISNVFIIYFLLESQKTKLRLVNIRSNIVNVVGVVAIIDSFVTQFPKFFLKIADGIELIAEFTIYFYFIFPLGLLMEAISILLLKTKNRIVSIDLEKSYYIILGIGSILYLLVIIFLYNLRVFEIKYDLAIICILFGITNYSILHIANTRIVNFSGVSKFKFLSPYIVYGLLTLLLCWLNTANSLLFYFMILLFSSIVKGLLLRLC